MTIPAIPLAFGLIVIPALAIAIAVTAIAFIGLTMLRDYLSPQQDGPEQKPKAESNRQNPRDLHHALSG